MTSAVSTVVCSRCEATYTSCAHVVANQNIRIGISSIANYAAGTIHTIPPVPPLSPTMASSKTPPPTHSAQHIRTHLSLPKQKEYYRECFPQMWGMALARMNNEDSPLHPSIVLQKNEPFVVDGKLHVDHLDSAFDDFRSPVSGVSPQFACIGCHFFRGVPYATEKNDKSEPPNKRLRPHVQHWTRHGCHYMNLYVVMCDLRRTQSLREEMQSQSTVLPLDQLDTSQLEKLQVNIADELSRRNLPEDHAKVLTAEGLSKPLPTLDFLLDNATNPRALSLTSMVDTATSDLGTAPQGLSASSASVTKRKVSTVTDLPEVNVQYPQGKNDDYLPATPSIGVSKTATETPLRMSYPVTTTEIATEANLSAKDVSGGHDEMAALTERSEPMSTTMNVSDAVTEGAVNEDSPPKAPSKATSKASTDSATGLLDLFSTTEDSVAARLQVVEPSNLDGINVWHSTLTKEKASVLFHRIANARKFLKKHMPDEAWQSVRTWKQVVHFIQIHRITPDASDPVEIELLNDVERDEIII